MGRRPHLQTEKNCGWGHESSSRSNEKIEASDVSTWHCRSAQMRSASATLSNLYLTFPRLALFAFSRCIPFSLLRQTLEPGFPCCVHFDSTFHCHPALHCFCHVWQLFQTRFDLIMNLCKAHWRLSVNDIAAGEMPLQVFAAQRLHLPLC